MKRIVNTLLLMVSILVFANMPVKAADSINFSGYYEKNDTNVVVTLKVDENEATSGEFTMTYDSAKVELVSATVGDSFGNDVISSVKTADGTITVGFAGTDDIHAGTLLTAEFTALTNDALSFPVTVKEWSASERNDLLADVKTATLTEMKATALTATKTKNAYEIGDTLNVDDLTVTATFENGSKKAVTGYTTDAAKIDMNTAGNKTLKVTYKGVTANVAITVKGHTVSFNANGGKDLSKNNITVNTHNAKLGTLPTVVRKDYDFKGWYTAKTGGAKVTTATKVDKTMTLYAQWTKTAVPAKGNAPTLASKKAGQATVSFKKVTGAKGYQITYSTSKLFTKKTTKSVYVTKTSKTLTGLTKGKTYYVKVRAYVLDSAGNKVLGKYSSSKNVITAPDKAKAPTLASKKSGQLKVSYKKVTNAKGYQITYSTSKKFTKATTKSVTTSKTSTTLKNLKKGTTYYVKVRAYVNNASKDKVYGAYGTVKSLKVKK